MKEDLLQDDTFLARWLAGELTESEMQQFRMHPDYIYFEQLARTSKNLAIPQIDKQKVLANIKRQKSTNPKTSPTRTFFSRRFFIPAAAMLFLIIGYFAIFHPSDMLLSTGVGEQLTHTLPDDSKIYLNANAQISYDPKKFTQQRIIKLEGEALFEVSKGNSFIVKTNYGQVEVLGTVFSVYSRNNVLLVSCKSGQVRVSDQSQNHHILEKGDRIRTIAGILQHKESVSPESIGTWKEGKSSFDSEELQIVATTLEQQFGISIELKASLARERFSGSFLHKDLDTALKMVFDPMGLKYNKSANGVYIIQ